jgi:hypothetical protein
MNNTVVIARYNEDVNWVKNLNWDYLIYNKGEDINGIYKQIPNIGREGETYLRYIIEFYNNLPNYIAFVQGDPFPHCKNLVDIINTTPLTNQIIPLSDKIVNDNPDKDLLNYNIKNLKLNYPQDLFTFPAGAQYIIPKKYIINKSLLWWENCYNLYISDSNNPWAFERIWPLIFNHYETV